MLGGADEANKKLIAGRVSALRSRKKKLEANVYLGSYIEKQDASVDEIQKLLSGQLNV